MTANGRMFLDSDEDAERPLLTGSVIDRLKSHGLYDLAKGVCERHGIPMGVVFNRDCRRLANLVRCRDEVIMSVRRLRSEWKPGYLALIFGMDRSTVLASLGRTINRMGTTTVEGVELSWSRYANGRDKQCRARGLRELKLGSEPVEPMGSSRALGSLARQICSESSSAVSSLSQSFSAVETSGLSLNAGARDPEATAAAATVEVKHQESGGEDGNDQAAGEAHSGYVGPGARRSGRAVASNARGDEGPAPCDLGLLATDSAAAARGVRDDGLDGLPIRNHAAGSREGPGGPGRAADEAELKGADDGQSGKGKRGFVAVGGMVSLADATRPGVGDDEPSRAGSANGSGDGDVAKGGASMADSNTQVPVGREQESLLTELRRHPLFALLDLQHNVGLGMTQLQAGKRLEWVIKAIADYADANTGVGLALPAVQRGLAGYIRNSRAPKVIDAPAGRQEPAMAKGIDYPELKRERKAEQAKAAMPADVARMAKLIAGLGRGTAGIGGK